MSRRRLEQGSLGASSFSLRALQVPPSTPQPVASAGIRRTGLATAAPPSVPTQAPSLNFRFSTLSGAVPVAPKAAEAPRLPNNFFSRPVGSGGAQGTADVLRLTAVVDDLTQRLRKTTDIRNQLEGQMQRMNQALAQERSNAGSRIQALKAEVGAAADVEHKLRSELAGRPAAKEVDSNKFAASVRSALEQEESAARVADAEARVNQLSRRQEALGAEVKLLEDRRGEGLALASLSGEEIEALVTRGAEAQARLTELEEQHEVIQDSISHLEARRTQNHQEIATTDMALVQANETTAASVADATAAKAQVQSLLLEHANVAAQIGQMNLKLQSMSGVVARPQADVSGAVAPHGLLGQISASCTNQIDTLSCCATGVPYHFAHDCPINICMAPTGASPEGDSSNEMIAAIVADLKGKFNYVAQEHAKIGVPTTPAPVEVSA